MSLAAAYLVFLPRLNSRVRACSSSERRGGFDVNASSASGHAEEEGPNGGVVRKSTGGGLPVSRRVCALMLVALLGGCVSAAPSLTGYKVESEESPEALRGHVVVLSFWAEWCKPCLEEYPIVSRVAEGAGSGVLFLAMYYRERPGSSSNVYQWLAGQPSSFVDRVYWGNGSFLAQYNLRSLPKTYVLARDGSVIAEFRDAILEDRASELGEAVKKGLAMTSLSER